MRKLIIAAAVLTLAACNTRTEPTADASAEPAASASADSDAAAATSLAGTYEETGKDGKVLTTVIKDDGTYTESVEGKVTESGKWAQKDGKDCFDPEGADTPERCFTTSTMASDGTFSATSDKGETITVKKIS